MTRPGPLIIIIVFCFVFVQLRFLSLNYRREEK